MGSHDDKYQGEDEQTQVRSIISQLNEDRPSKEKSREVVVRPDGSKVIRVTKKRRVMVSEREKNLRSRRAFVMGLMVAFLGLVLMGAFFAFRMSSMTGDAYMEESVSALKEAWGAKDVRVSGKGIAGSELHLTSLVAEFPEGSFIEKVELTNVEAELDSLTFFTKCLVADELKIGRAEIRLNRDARKLEIPHFKGGELWNLRRVVCEDFSVKMGEESKTSPVALSGARAYLYHPRLDDLTACVLSVEGGTLQLGAWKTVYLKECKFHISPDAVEEFRLVGSTNRPTEQEEASRTSLSVFGRLKVGEPLVGPYGFDAENIPLADLTNGRVEQFLTARMQSVPGNKSKATITLPLETELPEFNGEVALKSICLSGMPAQTVIAEHIAPAKRRLYLPLRVTRGFAVLEHEDGALSVELPDGGAVERDLLTMRGKLTVNAANELSGKMEYALPVLLTRVEYTDGISDPVFRENGELAWLSTTLSGTANAPGDNTSELERNAETARAARGTRVPFAQIDVERMAEEAQKESAKLRETFEKGDTVQPTENSESGSDSSDPFGDKGKTDDPFALPTPF